MEQRVADIATSIITARLAEDEDALDLVLHDIFQDDLPMLVGALSATASNMVGLLAKAWSTDETEVTPVAAWETIQELRRRMDLP